MWEVLGFGFSQGFVVGPVTLFGIREGLSKDKGFFYQMQVIIGSILVDFVYLLLATYGAAQVIDHFFIRLIMWLIASYMLIMMGINTFHERPKRLTVHHLHRHKWKIFESDFFRGGFIALISPLSLVFWIMVAGGIYADVKEFLTPSIFALLVAFGTLIASSLVAVMTLFVKKIFHEIFLKRLIALSGIILIGYGIWFYFKATFEVSSRIFGSFL